MSRRACHKFTSISKAAFRGVNLIPGRYLSAFDAHTYSMIGIWNLNSRLPLCSRKETQNLKDKYSVFGLQAWTFFAIVFVMNIAVLKTGGKQYLVKEGDMITIEKLP